MLAMFGVVFLFTRTRPTRPTVITTPRPNANCGTADVIVRVATLWYSEAHVVAVPVEVHA